MNEGLEEANAEPVAHDTPPEAGLPARLSDPLPDASAAANPAAANSASAPPASAPSWLRLAYTLEFLIALIAILTVWTQVGGQGHLDLLPWYTKLACVLAWSWSMVRVTAAVVEHERLWNRRTRLWMTGVILASAAMFGITYYYHLHEVPDETDGDETSATSVSVRRPAASMLQI